MARRPARRPRKRDLLPPAPAPEKRRSHAAAPIAVAVLFVGLVLGTVWIVLPVIFGAFLFVTGLSFLSTRLNPLSLGFYLNTKPSWSAIGVIFLSAVLLFLAAWGFYVHGVGPLVPGRA